MAPDDPFAGLEEAVARQSAQEQALKALAQSRCRLVLDKDAPSAFFATLALRLTPQVDWSLPTMATDGKKLFLNPRFVQGLTPDELLGVVAHEVLHNALKHHARRAHREPGLWNVAADLAANPLLLDAGFTLPASRLVPGEGRFSHLPPGRSAEEYYTLLSEQKGGGPGHGGSGPDTGGSSQDGDQTEEGRPDDQGGRQGHDPGGCGGVRDPADGSPAGRRESEAEWDVAVAQARPPKGAARCPAAWPGWSRRCSIRRSIGAPC
jgi:hypothetical protein